MAKKNPDYVQVVLQSLETGHTLYCWLDDPSRFKVGSVVSLKGEEGRWNIITKFTTRKKRTELNTDWKVGGIA